MKIALTALAVLAAAGLLVLGTGSRAEYECANTCERRVVRRTLGVTVQDVVHTNAASEWVRSQAESDLPNDWVLYARQSLSSDAGGCVSQKAALLKRLHANRDAPEAPGLLEELLAVRDPVPGELSARVRGFLEGRRSRATDAATE